MICAVIINFHDERRTIDFVRREMTKLPSPSHVIVVDNESTEKSFSLLNSSLPEASILSSNDNLGFAKANNMGAKYAMERFRPDYILFSNNDIRICEDNCVDTLATVLKEHVDAAAAGPKVIGLDGRFQSPSPFQTFADRHILLYWSNLYMSRKCKEKRFKTDYAQTAQEGFHYLVSGCFFLVRASDYAACGGMDPDTFLYAEEMMLSERFKATGKGVWYCPSVSVVHEHGTTTKRYFDRRKIRRLKFESECLYYRKYIGTPRWQIFLAKLTYGIKDLLRR